MDIIKTKVLILDTGKKINVCLESEDFTTCQAFDRDEALGLLEAEQPDVMVCNLEVPGGDVNIINKIKSACPDVQVVVLVPKGNSEKADAARTMGAVDVLEDPVTADLLTRTIKKAFQIGRDIQSSIEASRLANQGQHEKAIQLIQNELK
jgi:two-component system NtrC family response regulator